MEFDRVPRRGCWAITLPALLSAVVVASVIAVVVAGRIRDRQEARRRVARQQASAYLERARAELHRLETRLYVPDYRSHAVEFEEVERNVRRALGHVPDYAEAHCVLARWYELQDQRFLAERAWRAAVADDATHRPAHFGLGMCLLEQAHLVGDTPLTARMRQDAVRAFDAALRDGRLVDETEQTCAEVAQAQLAGNAELARAIAARGIERLRARAGVERLMWLVSSFDEAVRVCPSKPLLHASRSRTRLREQDALTDLHRALQISVHFTEAHWMAARLQRTRDRQAAGEHYRRVLETAPPDWPFRAQVEREIGGQ